MSDSGVSVRPTSQANSLSDLSGVDPSTAVQMVMFAYMGQVSGLLKGAVQDAQNHNELINQTNSMIASIRGRRPSDLDGSGDLSQEQCDWLAQNGTSQVNGETLTGRSSLTQGDFDQILNSCNSVADSQSNLAQQFSLTLQSLTNKQNQATDMISNQMEQQNNTMTNITTNMR